MKQRDLEKPLAEDITNCGALVIRFQEESEIWSIEKQIQGPRVNKTFEQALTAIDTTIYCRDFVFA